MNTTTLTTKPTFADVDRLYDAWVALQNEATTWDEAIAEPHASQCQAAHLAYLRAETARTGISNDALIVLLYGKEALNTPEPTPATPAPVTPSTETPAETPADSHRIRGTVVYVNGRRGSIAYEGGLDTQWFAFILGGVMPVHGMAVEFEFAGILFGHKAVNVVAVGHAASEAAYQALLAAPKRPNPAEERRALQDRVKANLRESSAKLREIEKARIVEIRKAHGLE